MVGKSLESSMEENELDYMPPGISSEISIRLFILQMKSLVQGRQVAHPKSHSWPCQNQPRSGGH